MTAVVDFRRVRKACLYLAVHFFTSSTDKRSESSSVLEVLVRDSIADFGALSDLAKLLLRMVKNADGKAKGQRCVQRGKWFDNAHGRKYYPLDLYTSSGYVRWLVLCWELKALSRVVPRIDTLLILAQIKGVCNDAENVTCCIRRLHHFHVTEIVSWQLSTYRRNQAGRCR